MANHSASTQEMAAAMDAALASRKARNQIEYSGVISSDAVRMGEIFGVGYSTAAGVAVTEYTAMQVSAVYACVRLIAGAIACLPASIYKRTEDGREAFKHDYWWLLNEQPCARFTAASMWEYAVAQVLLRGDGLILINRTGSNPAAQDLIPLRREQVTIKLEGARLAYYVEETIDGKRGYFKVDQDDMLHFPGMGFDGTSSMSVIGHAARQAIGTAIQADQFAGKFYGSGAQLQHVVKAPGQMSPEQQEGFRQAFVAKYGSGQGPNSTPLILTEGLEIQQLSMNMVDAQLLESRKFQVIDIARAFGVPAFMIGEMEKSTSWGSGIEQMGIGFVKYTLGPHLRRFEQELNRKLFPKRATYFIEFNTDGLMRGDATARANYYKAALGGTQSPAWMTQNEVRKLDNLPPMKGGDQLHDPAAQAAAAADAAEKAKPEPEAKPDDAMAKVAEAAIAKLGEVQPQVINVHIPERKTQGFTITRDEDGNATAVPTES